MLVESKQTPSATTSERIRLIAIRHSDGCSKRKPTGRCSRRRPARRQYASVVPTSAFLYCSSKSPRCLRAPARIAGSTRAARPLRLDPDVVDAPPCQPANEGAPQTQRGPTCFSCAPPSAVPSDSEPNDPGPRRHRPLIVKRRSAVTDSQTWPSTSSPRSISRGRATRRRLRGRSEKHHRGREHQGGRVGDVVGGGRRLPGWTRRRVPGAESQLPARSARS